MTADTTRPTVSFRTSEQTSPNSNLPQTRSFGPMITASPNTRMGVCFRSFCPATMTMRYGAFSHGMWTTRQSRRSCIRHTAGHIRSVLLCAIRNWNQEKKKIRWEAWPQSTTAMPWESWQKAGCSTGGSERWKTRARANLKISAGCMTTAGKQAEKPHP